MDEKPKLDTGHFLSMEKYLQLTMEPIRGRLEDVNSSLEKLSISITEYEHMKYQVATHSEAVREFEKAIVELEKKVSTLENFRKIVLWIGGIATTIGIGLASRYIDSFFP